MSTTTATNKSQAGTVIAFYNGVAVKAASEKDDNRFPDEYR